MRISKHGLLHVPPAICAFCISIHHDVANLELDGDIILLQQASSVQKLTRGAGITNVFISRAYMPHISPCMACQITKAGTRRGNMYCKKKRRPTYLMALSNPGYSCNSSRRKQSHTGGDFVRTTEQHYPEYLNKFESCQ